MTKGELHISTSDKELVHVDFLARYPLMIVDLDKSIDLSPFYFFIAAVLQYSYVGCTPEPGTGARDEIIYPPSE